MKNYVIFCGALLITAACSAGHLENPPSFSLSGGTSLSQLSVKWNGAVSPEYITREVDINGAKQLDVVIKGYSNSEEPASECFGSAKLTDNDFQKILDLIDEAKLYDYQPPALDDEKCKAPVGTAGVTVSYIRGDRSQNGFTSICTLDANVTDLLDQMDMAAEKYITDCTWEMVNANLP
jgi:hypothetical protein